MATRLSVNLFHERRRRPSPSPPWSTDSTTFRGRNRLSVVTHAHPSRVKTHYVFEHRLYFSKDAVNKVERQPFDDESILVYD